MYKKISSTPKVSIGMPVYNGERFIREALDTILAQTLSDFELIISDNASTDGTGLICNEYASADSRVRYVRQSLNKGVGANWSFVLEQAKGEYFMWAAHDDRWEPSYLAEMSGVLDSDKSVGLAFCGRSLLDLNTGITTPSFTGFTTSRIKLVRYLFRLLHCEVCLIYGLHRITTLRALSLMTFDYYDVYLSRWYELESAIRVVPKVLFYVGSDGERVPHSVTGSKISYKTFFLTEFKLLRKHFGSILGLFLLSLSAMQRLKHLK